MLDLEEICTYIEFINTPVELKTNPKLSTLTNKEKDIKIRDVGQHTLKY